MSKVATKKVFAYGEMQDVLYYRVPGSKLDSLIEVLQEIRDTFGSRVAGVNVQDGSGQGAIPGITIKLPKDGSGFYINLMQSDFIWDCWNGGPWE